MSARRIVREHRFNSYRTVNGLWVDGGDTSSFIGGQRRAFELAPFLWFC